MTSSFVYIENKSVHYRTWGSGAAIILCFHGFGEHSRSFEQLALVWPHHMIIAIDLPFHGDTDWEKKKSFEVEELISIIEACPEIRDRSFALLGYSMGGRLALSLYEKMPQKVEFMVLLAPDGLVVNPWYWFATKTAAGKKLFYHTMKNPQWFLSLLNFSKHFRLVNQSISRFIHSQVDDEIMRARIYQVWTGFKSFSPDLKNIAAAVLKHHTPVYLLFGRYDRIIRPGKGRAFVNEIKPYGKINVIESGHQLLHPKNIPLISEAISYCYRRKTAGV